MERKVLYQIKTLDKLILRSLIDNNSMNTCNISLTQTQMHIMAYILKSTKKEVYQKDLEEALNLRRATISGVLHTMETNNLIIRVTDSSDTRTKKIILNNKAKEIFDKNKEKIEELEKAIVKNISNEELNIFFSIIERMKENVKETYNTLNK